MQGQGLARSFGTSSKVLNPQPKPKAPPVDTMIVTIPEGSQPGDELSFTAPSGQEGNITDLHIGY